MRSPALARCEARPRPALCLTEAPAKVCARVFVPRCAPKRASTCAHTLARADPRTYAGGVCLQSRSRATSAGRDRRERAVVSCRRLRRRRRRVRAVLGRGTSHGGSAGCGGPGGLCSALRPGGVRALSRLRCQAPVSARPVASVPATPPVGRAQSRCRCGAGEHLRSVLTEMPACVWWDTHVRTYTHTHARTHALPTSAPGLGPPLLTSAPGLGPPLPTSAPNWVALGTTSSTFCSTRPTKKSQRCAPRRAAAPVRDGAAPSSFRASRVRGAPLHRAMLHCCRPELLACCIAAARGPSHCRAPRAAVRHGAAARLFVCLFVGCAPCAFASDAQRRTVPNARTAALPAGAQVRADAAGRAAAAAARARRRGGA
jgi:hypothetical protein